MVSSAVDVAVAVVMAAVAMAAVAMAAETVPAAALLFGLVSPLGRPIGPTSMCYWSDHAKGRRAKREEML